MISMTLTLSAAAELDVDRIATIHMTAFGANLMLQAQFPSEAIRGQLKICVAEKALADIRDPQTAVLVVRDQDKIVSFAKWHLPVHDSEATYEEPPWSWPAGTNMAVLDAWIATVEAAKLRIIGNTPCYPSGLSFLATDPCYERRGAASMLLKWAIDRCMRENAPAYLESTVEASALYKRNGFTAVETIATILEGNGKDIESSLYEEVCFVFTPDITVDATGL